MDYFTNNSSHLTDSSGPADLMSLGPGTCRGVSRGSAPPPWANSSPLSAGILNSASRSAKPQRFAVRSKS